MKEDDKGCQMIRLGVSGWVFLLVPAYLGCPRQKPLNGCVCVCVLWCCWLGGRKGIQPVKKTELLAWLSVCSKVQTCIMAQLMPLPLTVSCFSKIICTDTWTGQKHNASVADRMGSVGIIRSKLYFYTVLLCKWPFLHICTFSWNSLLSNLTLSSVSSTSDFTVII